MRIHWREVASTVVGAKTFLGCAPRTNGLAAIIDTLTIDGREWRHLSVSRRSRTPSHEDMMAAAEAFLDRDHVALSIYPRRSEWVNVHEFCLHLWQPIGFDPVPDPQMERARSVGWMTPAEREAFDAWRKASGR